MKWQGETGREGHGHEMPLNTGLLFGCLSLHWAAMVRGSSDVTSSAAVPAVNPEQ